MAVDRAILALLKKYAVAFKEARERGANESDTVMFITKFIEDVLGWDTFKGEISKELAIKDRYCDIALKLDGVVRLLVECKAASSKGLSDKNIEQAENYASRSGIKWVALTNGIEWRLYHLTFAEGEGITHELAFEANLVEDVETRAEALWWKLGMLTRKSIADENLEAFWSQKKILSPASVVRVLFNHDVLTIVRRELNRISPARLEITDIFAAIREVLSKEALMEAGDIGINKRRKRRRKVTRTNSAGVIVTEEVEEDDPESPPELAPAIPPTGENP